MIRRKPPVTAYRAGLAPPLDYAPPGLERGAWVATDGTRCSGYRWSEFLFIEDQDTRGRPIWVVAEHRTGRTVTWTGSLNAALATAGYFLVTARVAGRG